jgi:hypothetical protein
MAFSMYQASVPVFVRGLQNLGAVLEKGRADAVARGFDPAVLIGSRLAPDMFPLSRQVQVASDMVKNGAARLAQVELPAFPDTETSFEELQARIEKTVTFLRGITAAQLEGSEARTIVLTFPGREMEFSGADYLSLFVVPNFYFHLTTAYLILRHNGVAIGKTDFMGA